MKKIITSYLIVSTIALTPMLQAKPRILAPILADAYDPSTEPIPAAPSEMQEPNQEEQKEPEIPTPPVPTPNPEAADPEPSDEEYPGTPVSEASEKNRTKSHRWRNIVIAIVAVAVAVTALILVGTNDGHRRNK